jgi:hypothetical protein
MKFYLIALALTSAVLTLPQDPQLAGNNTHDQDTQQANTGTPAAGTGDNGSKFVGIALYPSDNSTETPKKPFVQIFNLLKDTDETCEEFHAEDGSRRISCLDEIKLEGDQSEDDYLIISTYGEDNCDGEPFSFTYYDLSNSGKCLDDLANTDGTRNNGVCSMSFKIDGNSVNFSSAFPGDDDGTEGPETETETFEKGTCKEGLKVTWKEGHEHASQPDADGATKPHEPKKQEQSQAGQKEAEVQ